MQNIPPIQCEPDTLLKNFFIAGLKQDTLKEILALHGDPSRSEVQMQNMLRNLDNLDPEVLFSLYEEEDELTPLLYKVFSQQISIKMAKKDIMQPKFFSFMTSNTDKFFEYCHVLVFYERVTQDQVKNEFSKMNALNKIITKMRSAERNRNTTKNSRANSDLAHQYGNIKMHKKAQDLAQRSEESKSFQKPSNMAIREPSKNIGSVENPEEIKQQFKQVKLLYEQERAASQSLQKRGNTFDDRKRAEEFKEEGNDEESKQRPMAAPQSKLHYYETNQLMQSVKEKDSKKKEAFKNQIQETAANNNAVLAQDNSLSTIQRQSTREIPLQRQSSDFFSEERKTMYHDQAANRRAVQTEIIVEVSADDKSMNSSMFPSNQQQNQLQGRLLNYSQEEEYFYTPVAFVFETLVEHPDFFKQILMLLFENLVKDQQEGGEILQKNKSMFAFANMLTHVTFLATLPAPSFNTRFHINLYDRLHTVDESADNELPHRNDQAILILFKVLDIRSIFYCWKAILLNKTLVLISTSSSLQFQVQQALLQLLFPFPFQQSCISLAHKWPRGPCCADKQQFRSRNEACRDKDTLTAGMAPSCTLMTCTESRSANFDKMEKLAKKHNMEGQVAICNIDGSFTNNIEMKTLDDERTIQKSLWHYKQMRDGNATLDDAFPSSTHDADNQEGETVDELFCKEIRNFFFNLLEQFLCFLQPDKHHFKMNMTKAREQGAMPNFDTFFNKQAYLADIPVGNKPFAEELLKTEVFMKFVSDVFDRGVMNITLYCKFRQLNPFKENNPQKEKKFNQALMSLKRSSKFQFEIAKEIGVFKRPEWPATTKSDFYWRMPVDCQSSMLFDKLMYAVRQLDLERQQLQDETAFAQSLDASDDELERRQQEYLIHLSKQIDQIKEIYRGKLSKYALQYQKAGKNRVPEWMEEVDIGGDDSRIQMSYSELSKNATHNAYIDEAFGEEFKLKEDGSGSERSQEQQTDQQNNDRITCKLVYGEHGLIDFLELLFMQFPSKKKVRRQFNYYFALKEQIKMAEYASSLKQVELDRQKHYVQQMEVQKNFMFDRLNQDEEDNEGQFFSSLQIRSKNVLNVAFTSSKLLRGLGTTTEESLKSQVSETLITSVQNTAFLKRGQTFKNVSEDIWFLPRLPRDLLMNSSQVTDFDKWVAHRTSYQFINLKQKLYSVFEDREEANKLILGELMFYPQNGQDIFPFGRFQEILEYLIPKQRQEVMRKIYEIYIMLEDSEEIFQLREFFEQNEAIRLSSDEGFDPSMFQYKTHPMQLKHAQSDGAFLRGANGLDQPESPLVKTRKMTALESNNNMRIEDDSNFRELDNEIFNTQKEIKRRVVVYERDSPKYQSFSELAGHIRSRTVSEPEYVSSQILANMVDLAAKVMRKSRLIDNEYQLTENEKKRYMNLLHELRQLINDQFSDQKFKFDVIMGEGIIDLMDDEKKHCFWLNIMNYTILDKLIELFISDQSQLDELNSCTRFMCLLTTVKIRVCQQPVTAYEIMKTMLKLDAKGGQRIRLLGGPCEFFSSTSFLADTSDGLKVFVPLDNTFFGIFLPIKKWSDFEIFEPQRVEAQLKQVAQRTVKRLQVDPRSFLISIPRQLAIVYKHARELMQSYHHDSLFANVVINQPDGGEGQNEENKSVNDGLEQSEASKSHFVKLLQGLIYMDQGLVEPHTRKNQEIKTVLDQIKEEGESSAHIFEIESLEWKFDMRIFIKTFTDYTSRGSFQEMLNEEAKSVD